MTATQDNALTIPQSLRRWLIAAQLVIAPVGVGVLLYLLVGAIPAVHLEEAAGTFAGSFAVALAGFALFGLRLQLVLEAFSLPMGRRPLWRIHLTSLFYYFLLPAGVGYDLSKGAKIAVQLPGRSRRRIVAAVATERVVGGVGVYLLLLGALPFVELADWPGPQQETVLRWLWLLLVVATAGGGLALVHRARRRTHYLLPLLLAAGVSVAGHLLLALAIWFVAASLGLPLNPAETLVAVAGTLLLQLVPVNLIGVSLGEVAAVAVYLAVGLSQPGALLLATVGYAHRLAAAVVGGALEGVNAARTLQREAWGRKRSV